jgi:hypothetical protein
MKNKQEEWHPATKPEDCRSSSNKTNYECVFIHVLPTIPLPAKNVLESLRFLYL